MNKGDNKILFTKDEKNKIVKNVLIFLLLIGVSITIMYLPSFEKEE